MAAFKMILSFAVISCAWAASLNIQINEQKENLRVRRQFANPGSTLQQTIQGIPNNRRPGQSGNFGSGQGSNGVGNQGQGSNGFGNQGQGFGNQGQGSNGFGNPAQGPNGFGNQGQGFGNQGQGSNGFGNQGQSSNGFGNNQGGSNGGGSNGGGQFGWTTQRPPFNIISNENSIDAQTSACIRNCGVVNNYNPICGNDNVTYQNPQKLRCAQQQCNRQVQAAYNGACITTRAPNGR